MVEESVATGSMRPVSTSGNGCAESSWFVVLSMWMRKWVHLRFLVKVIIELCGGVGVLQICNEVRVTDVQKVVLRPKDIRECALEALRLRRRRLKRLKARETERKWVTERQGETRRERKQQQRKKRKQKQK